MKSNDWPLAQYYKHRVYELGYLGEAKQQRPKASRVHCEPFEAGIPTNLFRAKLGVTAIFKSVFSPGASLRAF